MSIKVNVLGSCVSRVSLLDGNQKGHGIADDRLELGYFLDKQNMALAMMPSAFSKEEVSSIKAEELWDKSRINTLKQALNKETINLLMESDAEYLIVDLYDFYVYFNIIGNTAFDNVAFEFQNTSLHKKYKEYVKYGHFFEMAQWIYYPYVDLFFKTIIKKYDSDHIILNRFRCNKYYLAKDGEIKIIPNEFKAPCHPNDKYNMHSRALEDYIISKYNPYVIDVSKYYMGNENDWSNLQGAHFEMAFYHHTFDIIKEIIFYKPNKRVWDECRFFEKRYDENYNLNIEKAVVMFNDLSSKNDLLALNLLDKLYHRFPNNTAILKLISDLNLNK